MLRPLMGDEGEGKVIKERGGKYVYLGLKE